MIPKSLLKRIPLALLLTLGAIALLWRIQSAVQPSNGGSPLPLLMPSFIQVARAEDAGVLSTISEEAGVSAWFKSASTIDLTTVRGLYRTIENETADYIVGSVAIKDYPESEDVHVYIHKDGWILAYYLKAEPAAKIFDWRDYELNEAANVTTKLENTIANIMVVAGSPFDKATYYDFRYPNATHLMLIIEDATVDPFCHEVDNSFTLNLPLSHTVYERSWFAAGGNGAIILLDGTEIGRAETNQGNMQGTLLVTQLTPDESHTVTVNIPSGCNRNFGGIALVYKEQ